MLLRNKRDTRKDKERSPAGYCRAAEMRHIEGIAEGSLAPALAVSTAAFLSAVATASGPVEPFAPIDSKSAWTEQRWCYIRVLERCINSQVYKLTGMNWLESIPDRNSSF